MGYVPKSMQKYIKAQQALARHSSYDDGDVIKAFGMTPNMLYEHMRRCGFVWDTRQGIWHLKQGVKRVRLAGAE
jgi:ACT domain-containing protein